MPSSLEKKLEEHIATEEARFGSLEGKLDVIKDNHLVHLQSELTEAKLDRAMLRIDMDWIKRFLWAAILPAVGGLVAGVLNLLMK